MSSKRLVFTCTVAAVALAGGSTAAIRALPLLEQSATIRQTTPGPLEQRAKPITPENPVPRRVNYEAPATPAEARAAGAVASVSVMITLDELGRVVEARGLQVAMTSRNPAVSFNLTDSGAIRNATSRAGLTAEQSDAVVAIVAAYEQAVVQAVQQWRYEPPAAGPISFPITVGFSDTREATDIQGVPTRGFAARASSIATEGALRVGGNVKSPTKIVDVPPVYPPIAQANKISGLVILEIRVGRDGAVEDAQVLRSIPLLDAAALDAVRGWRFTPTLLNGAPVPVVMTVTVNFTLQGGGVSGGVAGGVTEGIRGGVVGGVGASVPRPKQGPALLKEVKPVYPKEAMDAGVEGDIEMEIQIGTDGSVMDARVLRSVPLLDEAALTAVRQWKFTPIPEPATVTVEMTFRTRPKR